MNKIIQLLIVTDIVIGNLTCSSRDYKIMQEVTLRASNVTESWPTYDETIWT